MGRNKIAEFVQGAPTSIRRVGILGFVSVLLYVVGLKFLLLPVLIVGNALYLPWPTIFRSWLSRLVMGGLMTMSLLQVAATLQFLVFPESGFKTLAAIVLLLHIVVLAIAPRQVSAEKRAWVTRTDVLGLLVAAFFLLPLAAMTVRKDPVEQIARIGSVQAIDATNHYAGIAEMTEAEHLNYKPGYYYPKGFHISIAFTENTLFDEQYDLGWKGNVVLYFMQYVFFGSLLAYVLYYFVVALFRHIAQRFDESKLAKSDVWLALTFGPTVSLIYLVPFVTEGFLNYYYVITTIVAAFVLLLALYEKRKGDLPVLKNDESLRWALFCYLILIFGASVSWPLLIPPLVVTTLLCVIPGSLSIKSSFVNNIHWRTIAVLAALLLQLVPVYFQLKYASSDGSQGGLNAIGGLKEFHPYVLLIGFLIVVWFILSQTANDAFKRALSAIFVPFAAFIGLLIMVQYYSAGEIRYYVIKSSMLLEIVMLALAVAALVFFYFQKTKLELKYALILPVIPFVIMIILIGSSANPMKALRDLVRDHSGQGYPAYFQQDTDNYVDLGDEGKIAHFNSTVLHYNPEQKKFYAHMQMAFWSNMMQYDSSDKDFHALHCVGALYSNLAFGTFTQAEQDFLVAKVKECATKAHERGETFYVLTDQISAPLVKQTFGGLVKVVY